VVVIGAGIVGICTASYLLRDGHDVLVLDPREPGTGCSFGNAGGISPGSCVPLAMPGVLRKVPGWLSDPEGPLHIRLAHLPHALPWLLRFVRNASRARATQASSALRALHRLTFECYEPLLARAGCADLISRRGQLLLYESEAELAADDFGLALRRERGVAVEILNQDELRQLEPGLAPIFARAAFLPEQGQCANPFRLVQTLARQFAADGGRIERREVRGFEHADGTIGALATDTGRQPASAVVVAAGAWSGRLCRELGHAVPLESERGYHVTVADPGATTRIQAMWMRRAFVATPMEMGMRFAGTVELAGLAAPPTERRAAALLRHGQRMIPGLRTEQVSTWMGHRPGTPDSVPVIGPSPGFGNLQFAFGHGHTGLIAGAVTGRVVADLIARRPPPIDIDPYRVERF
jgi:D-amino-acid dehydrogenase